jgi:transposase-like protein
MRLHLLLPKVDPKALPVPAKCVYPDCKSLQVRLHQPVKKALRDTVHQQVEVHRYRCLTCGRTFRVYPPGVGHAQSSDRVKGLAVLLYLLGRELWSGVVGVRQSGESRSPRRRSTRRCKPSPHASQDSSASKSWRRVKTKALGGDLTSVKCAGQWLHLGLTADSLSGLALTIDAVSAEDAATLKAWIEPIAASVGAQVLVSDDADGAEDRCR